MKKKRKKTEIKIKTQKNKNKNKKFKTPRLFFNLTLSLFLSLSEFLSFSHTLSSLPQIGVAQIGVEALGRWDSDHHGPVSAHG